MLVSSQVEALQSIAAQSYQESATLSELSRQGSVDAKVLKVLTVIATMYLPATLTAVSRPMAVPNLHFADD